MHHPLLALLNIPERGKVVSAREAVSLIRPGDTLATSGFVGTGFAEDIAIAIEERFLEPDAAPRIAGAGQTRRPDVGLCCRSGRWQKPWSESSRPRGPSPAGDRRALGSGAQTASTGGCQQD